MPLYENNAKKIEELQEFARFPCQQWIDECYKLGLSFQITEAFRSQDRQKKLYAQGRTAPGPIVTWTLKSEHTARTAVDIDPTRKMSGAALRVFLNEVAQVGQRYNIVRPEATLKVGDYRHFSLSNAKPYYPQLSLDQQKRLDSRKIRLLSGNTKERAIQRYAAQYGELPVIY